MKTMHLIPFCCMIAVGLCTAGDSSDLKRESFDTPPGWEGARHSLPVTFPPRLLQNFGYRTSNIAGKAPGEMGGYIQSSVRPAYYAKQITPLSFADRLQFSGSFALMEGRSIMGYHTLCETFIGFFNSAEQGWRPKNFLGFRFMGTNEPEGVLIEVNYTTSFGSAKGAFLQKGDTQAKERTIKNLDHASIIRIAPDGKKHTWNLRYTPDPAAHTGLLEFTLDDQTWTLEMDKTHYTTGAQFNRFGIFNNQLPGRAMTIYFDDLAINDVQEDFTIDPGWEGVGNTGYFDDPMLYGSHDFSYRESSYAGGKAGEIGGILWRVDQSESHLKCWYGDSIGKATFKDPLSAQGKICIKRFCIDTGMNIGFFNDEEQGWPPKNFIGVNLDSHTSVGRAFMPAYGTATTFAQNHGRNSPLFVDDGRPMSFSIKYDPSAADGLGTLTVHLGDEVSVLTLKPGDQDIGGILNRFGVFNMQDNNGKYCEVYLDDLEYTTME